MIFLNPSILLGLLAAAIPVLIHFLNLRKLQRVEFSTLSFLKELQKTKIRRIKFKQWLLLALRLMIILLLVMAFARPTIESVSLGGAASTAKSTAVFVLDNSYSMSVVNEQGSYFNQAKKNIKYLLNELKEGDEAALVTTTGGENDSKQTFSSKDKIISELEDLEISEVKGDVYSAIARASDILKASKNYNREIYLLSDFQKSNLNISKNDQNEKLTATIRENLSDKNIRLYTLDFGGQNLINLSVSDFEPNNQIFEKGKEVSFTATVANETDNLVNDAVLSLFINGERKAQNSVSITPGKSKKVTFETTLRETGLLEIFVELEEDAILNDNQRFSSIYIPEKINTLILHNNPSESRFLRLALEGNETENLNVTEQYTNRINSVSLNNYNTVYVVGTKNITSYSRLKEYVNNGGNLVVFPGAEDVEQNFNKFCSKLNLPSADAVIGNTNRNEAASFGNIDYKHPIFTDLFEGDNRAIDSPELYKYLKINTGGKGKSIISMIDNSTFLSEYKSGEGKILLFNTAPSLSWSNFPVKSIFAPLVNKSLFYLTNEIKDVTKVNAGEEINVSIANAAVPQIKVVKPYNSSEFMRMDEEKDKRFLKYDETNKLGIYKFYSGDELIDYAAVNFNPEESDINYVSQKEFEDELKDFNFAGTYVHLDAGGNFSESIHQARFGTELWRYFLILALLVAIIEMTIAKSAKKDLTEVNG